MKTLLTATLLCSALPVMACSNVMIHHEQFSAVGRTMDFPFNSGNRLGYGKPKQNNRSDLNLHKGKHQSQGASWRARHHYLGMVWQKSHTLIDGVNEKGVYAAYLYLSDFTKYPQFDETNNKKALGVFDVVNFVLATADSTQDAIKRLNHFQIIANAVPTKLTSKPRFLLNAPVHVIIRDKSGDSAVIQWQNGHTVIHQKAGPVLTNAPTYEWQVKHAKQYDSLQSQNTQAQFDGAYSQGSGFLGLPGDWTSANRFARATQVLKHLPTPHTQAQTIRQTLTTLESVQVPMGTNPSPSLWKTVYDLNEPTLYFYPMATLSDKTPVVNQELVEFNTPDLNHAWQKYSLKELAQKASLTEKLIEARSYATPPEAIQQVTDVVALKTPGAHDSGATLAKLFSTSAPEKS